jgi:hypothetical protein
MGARWSGPSMPKSPGRWAWKTYPPNDPRAVPTREWALRGLGSGDYSMRRVPGRGRSGFSLDLSRGYPMGGSPWRAGRVLLSIRIRTFVAVAGATGRQGRSFPGEIVRRATAASCGSMPGSTRAGTRDVPRVPGEAGGSHERPSPWGDCCSRVIHPASSAVEPCRGGADSPDPAGLPSGSTGRDHGGEDSGIGSGLPA